MGKRENEIECREKGKGRAPDLKSEPRVRGIGGSANAKTLDGPISAVPTKNNQLCFVGFWLVVAVDTVRRGLLRG